MEGLQHTRAVMGKRGLDDVPTKRKGRLRRGEGGGGCVVYYAKMGGNYYTIIGRVNECGA